jgi:hypothetical protein
MAAMPANVILRGRLIQIQNCNMRTLIRQSETYGTSDPASSTGYGNQPAREPHRHR